MPRPTSPDSYLLIHELLQEFYLRRREIRIQYAVGSLGISEAQILIELVVEQGVTAKRLSEVLQLEKSTISRVLAGLQKKRLIKTAPLATDKRIKELIVTEAGKAAVEELHHSQNRVLHECLAPLNAKEQSDLGYCLRILADGLKTTPAAALPTDHPITLEIVRLGRGLGMTGPRFMNSELSSTQYHLLKRIRDREQLTKPPVIIPDSDKFNIHLRKSFAFGDKVRWKPYRQFGNGIAQSSTSTLVEHPRRVRCTRYCITTVRSLNYVMRNCLRSGMDSCVVMFLNPLMRT
jgi:DNA-binding MarR family transcriptional regulator